MPKISFASNKKINSFDVPENSQLMKSLLNHNLPVSSSCSGAGICSKCRIKILSGRDNLSRETIAEVELRKRNKISTDYRISCQAFVLGDITVDADYW